MLIRDLHVYILYNKTVLIFLKAMILIQYDYTFFVIKLTGWAERHLVDWFLQHFSLTEIN